MSTNEWPLWEVFIRSKQGLSHKHVGSLRAADEQMAIDNARDVYTRRSEGISIWVVESNNVFDFILHTFNFLSCQTLEIWFKRTLLFLKC